MEIKKISKEQFDRLFEIQEKHPVLTLENKGYEYIRTPFGEETKKAVQEISEILKVHILGFSSFTNFRHSIKTKELQLRFDYNYNYDGGPSFIGVGYITVRELMNGFD